MRGSDGLPWTPRRSCSMSLASPTGRAVRPLLWTPMKPSWRDEVSPPTVVWPHPSSRWRSGITALTANHNEVPANCAKTRTGRMCRGTSARLMVTRLNGRPEVRLTPRGQAWRIGIYARPRNIAATRCTRQGPLPAVHSCMIRTGAARSGSARGRGEDSSEGGGDGEDMTRRAWGEHAGDDTRRAAGRRPRRALVRARSTRTTASPHLAGYAARVPRSRGARSLAPRSCALEEP